MESRHLGHLVPNALKHENVIENWGIYNYNKSPSDVNLPDVDSIMRVKNNAKNYLLKAEDSIILGPTNT
jgi:hypothetical protein